MSDNGKTRHAGRLELTWTDKDKALLSAIDGKYDYTFVDPADWRVSEVRLLDEVERYDREPDPDAPEGDPEPSDDNLLISGDAMHVLDALAKIPEYADRHVGKVKLVYIDPPFNTGQAFLNYEDNIEHSIWLTMLRDRLGQIKPLLAEDGSVWVHLDHVESHRCRSVLDEELGPENFVAEIAWQKATAPKSDTKGISISQDVILVYRKSAAWRPNRMFRLASTTTTRYKSRDGDRIPWRDDNATANGAATHQSMVYGIQHPVTGNLVYPTAGDTGPRSRRGCWSNCLSMRRTSCETSTTPRPGLNFAGSPQAGCAQGCRRSCLPSRSRRPPSSPRGATSRETGRSS